MAKATEKEVEIVVSTYWPTKIIKSISIKESGKDVYRNDITLSSKDARYVYEQLKTIYKDLASEQA